MDKCRQHDPTNCFFLANWAKNRIGEKWDFYSFKHKHENQVLGF